MFLLVTDQGYSSVSEVVWEVRDRNACRISSTILTRRLSPSFSPPPPPLHPPSTGPLEHRRRHIVRQLLLPKTLHPGRLHSLLLPPKLPPRPRRRLAGRNIRVLKPRRLLKPSSVIQPCICWRRRRRRRRRRNCRQSSRRSHVTCPSQPRLRHVNGSEGEALQGGSSVGL